eukprot:4697708-Alexandrium_andersonii.AAC.1
MADPAADQATQLSARLPSRPPGKSSTDLGPKSNCKGERTHAQARIQTSSRPGGRPVSCCAS